MLITAFIVSVTAAAQIPGGGRVSAPFEGERGEPNTLGGYLLLVGAVVTGLAINLKDKNVTRCFWMLLALDGKQNRSALRRVAGRERTGSMTRQNTSGAAAIVGWATALAFCWGLSGPANAQDTYLHLDVAVHASSWYSTGSAQIAEVAQAASDKGFDALIITDADVLRVDYVLPFFCNILASNYE